MVYLSLHDGPAVFTTVSCLPFTFRFNRVKIGPLYPMHVKTFRTGTLTELIFFNGQVTVTTAKFDAARVEQYKSLMSAI